MAVYRCNICGRQAYDNVYCKSCRQAMADRAGVRQSRFQRLGSIRRFERRK